MDCGEIETPENSEVTYNDPDHPTVLDSVVSYKCNNGYSLKGVGERTCLKSGKWGGQAPTCDGM